MASSDDDSEEDFVEIGTPVPCQAEGEPTKKPIGIQDLTARDKQGRRRFHGAFTGGFSAGFFNTVGTKEGFTPTAFVSSRSKKNFDHDNESKPEDFMDDEDLEEHGIAPRKFVTVDGFSSEDRKRKHLRDVSQAVSSTSLDLGSALGDLVVVETLPIGIKLLRKMGWREGQGLGPRVKRKRKKSRPLTQGVKIYGCALPPSDGDEYDSDNFLPANMSEVTFAPKDVTPVPLEPKDNVHGLGYRGLNPRLALPNSHVKMDNNPISLRAGRKGIRGQAFGVGAFEDEDEDIYTVDDMSNYDTVMQTGQVEDTNYGWTAPKAHGKQEVPVSYVGTLLAGFGLSTKPLQPKKKFAPPTLPRLYRPEHWSRKRRMLSHLPKDLLDEGQTPSPATMTAVDRGLLLGETPIMNSVFDLVSTEGKKRIEATKEAISITKSLSSQTGDHQSLRLQSVQTSQSAPSSSEERGGGVRTEASTSFLSKFRPAEMTPENVLKKDDGALEETVQSEQKPLFHGSLSFQPFRKDAAKQERYDKYLALVKQGVKDPYAAIANPSLTEWERARERDEFARSAKIFRPLSAMMSTRFVRGAMIDDEKTDTPMPDANDLSDQAKAAEMKMFGKLTREETEWHPDPLLCRRMNVPNPYPGSDIIGLPTVKRDKYSVFNFLTFGDFQSGDTQEPSQDSRTGGGTSTAESKETVPAAKPSKPTLASVFNVLDDPEFHRPSEQDLVVKREPDDDAGMNEQENAEEAVPDKDLFRAIFKNSDSEDSDDSSTEEKKDSEDSDDGKKKSDDEENDKDVTMEVDKAENSGKLVPLKESSDDLSKSLEQDQVPSSPCVLAAKIPEVKAKRPWTRWGQKSVFAVLEDLDKVADDSEKNSSLDPEARLSKPDDFTTTEEADDEYGPRLPPGLQTTPASASTHFSASKEKHSDNEYEQSSHNTEKHRSRGDRKHKHKKQKKKSKHKEKHLKKKSKKSRRKSSGSDGDSESNGEDLDTLDSELLHRIRQVSKSAKSPHSNMQH